MKIEADPKDVITKRTDRRGRLTLGKGHADKEVTVLVVETDE